MALFMSNKLQLMAVDLKAAQMESQTGVGRSDSFDISLFDHVLRQFAEVHFKISKYCRASRVVLELVSLNMSFNQNIDELFDHIVLD